jgi:hypothetical protein
VAGDRAAGSVESGRQAILGEGAFSPRWTGDDLEFADDLRHLAYPAARGRQP